jgi:tRNA(fMet)-specific endonuclease VapC
MNKYIEIDTFSQGKSTKIKSKFSARNMGKNDIWIASTALALEMSLVTTDGDFDHLNNVLLKVRKIPTDIINEWKNKK